MHNALTTISLLTHFDFHIALVHPKTCFSPRFFEPRFAHVHTCAVYMPFLREAVSAPNLHLTLLDQSPLTR